MVVDDVGLVLQQYKDSVFGNYWRVLCVVKGGPCDGRVKDDWYLYFIDGKGVIYSDFALDAPDRLRGAAGTRVEIGVDYPIKKLSLVRISAGA